MTPLLDTIATPQDLRRLSVNQLPQVCRELRQEFLRGITQSGGHFASNLGVIELTVALHYVFDTPNDHLLWDVGHQAYAHKILTGRREKIHTIRQKGGLAPFPKRDESEFDAFGVGHSSTSIGAALGFAVADKLSGKSHKAIAVIGDGAMTGGQAFEALNNAGDIKDANLLVILNDNEMSISQNVGALPKYLAQNAVQDLKGFIKETGKQFLENLPGGLDAARQMRSTLKEIVEPSLSLFDNFGFKYIGIIDGHDVLKLVEVLQQLKHKKSPQLLHIHTKKGKGFASAENNPTQYHAVNKNFDHQQVKSVQAAPKTYTQVFSDWLCDMAAADKKLVGITPAMCEGSGLTAFAKKFPNRYFDVGIAEQHAVTFAAGLACGGLKPVVAIYSTFLQRAFDQWIHDVALQNLPVLLAIDRAGIVGADGATHAGAYDLSFLRCVPNTIIATPSDENECRLLLTTCFYSNKPAAVRYPRGTGRGAEISGSLNTVEIGKGVVRRQGEKIAFFAFGSMLETALQAAENLNATVADMRFVKPLDIDLIKDLATTHDYLITIEENSEKGGAGSAVLEVLSTLRILKPLLILGILDIVTAHGDAKLILQDLGLDSKSVEKRVKAFVGGFQVA
ncbi:MAG: 1-deoxy-D-xylulose-5-phosphate synthase [Neisseriaceae bacterium]|nr:1-deoxy-D-xylulose-5-phosphate synthase [Neisseriaceae bacterium]